MDFSYWLDHFLLFTFFSWFFFHRAIIWKTETFIANIIMSGIDPLILPPVWEIYIEYMAREGRENLRYFFDSKAAMSSLLTERSRDHNYSTVRSQFFFFFSRKPLRHSPGFHKLKQATIMLSKLDHSIYRISEVSTFTDSYFI